MPGMSKMLAGLFAFLTLTGTTVYGVEEHAQNLIPMGAGVVGHASLRAVVQDAQARAMISGRPVAVELAESDLRQGAEAVTVDGSRVTWAVDGYCWTTLVEDAFSTVNVEECDARQP